MDLSKVILNTSHGLGKGSNGLERTFESGNLPIQMYRAPYSDHEIEASIGHVLVGDGGEVVDALIVGIENDPVKRLVCIRATLGARMHFARTYGFEPQRIEWGEWYAK
jgi:hypothetical protein